MELETLQSKRMQNEPTGPHKDTCLILTPQWKPLEDIHGIPNFRFKFNDDTRGTMGPEPVAPPSQDLIPFTIWLYTKQRNVEFWFGTGDPRNKTIPFKLSSPTLTRVTMYGLFHFLSNIPSVFSLENGKPIRICLQTQTLFRPMSSGQSHFRHQVYQECMRLWNEHGIEVHFVATDKRYDGRGFKFQEFIDGTFTMGSTKGSEDHREKGITVTRGRERKRAVRLSEIEFQ